METYCGINWAENHHDADAQEAAVLAHILRTAPSTLADAR